MNRFFEWLGRVIMLVLAGMITLSIIGAIASIPSGSSMQTRLGVEPQAWPEPRPSARAPVPQPARPQPEPSPMPQPSAVGPPDAELVAMPQPRPEPTAADWLESIAYTLLAIAGLLAFGLLLLWRALGHWRRTADSLERLAKHREPTPHRSS
jgi:hypothetical protein